MLRSSLLRTATPSLRATSSRRAVVAAPVAAARNVSTKQPTSSSAPPPPALAGQFAPGEEIDPQLNGYPQLPWVHFGQKPAKGWWDNQSKTNFGETLHEENDLLNLWAPDYHSVSGPKAAAGILAMLTFLGTLAYGFTLMTPELTAVRREYPYNGLEKELGGIVPARAEEVEDDEE